MVTNRPFHAYQQSEFATVAGGGGYQGIPNMRNESNFYPKDEYNYSGMQQQQLERGGAHMPAPPNYQGRAQEVQKSTMPDQQSKPVIRSKQELGMYKFYELLI